MTDAPSPTDPSPPGTPGALRAGVRVVGRYELLRELGRGGMGVVWLATDHTLQRQVAFKVLPDVLRQDRTALVDLRDETRRNLEITHPHIVRIYDFEEDAEVAGITMEFVDGETLGAKKSNRPQRVFDALELVPWLRQLCEALYYAHTDPRVVHRDLKPANLMVNVRGQLKVTDFGIARSITDSISRVSNVQATSGTLVYMSPQQLMGSSSPSDDIYSVGATLYDLLSGKPPFHTGNVSAQVLQATAPPMAERRAQLGRQGGPIPAIFEEVVAACLAKEPRDRPPSALAIIERIEAALGTSRSIALPTLPLPEPAPAPAPVAPLFPPPPSTPNILPLTLVPPPLPSPVELPPPRGPWALIAVLLIAGLLALAGGIYVGTHDGPAAKPTPAPSPPPMTDAPRHLIVNTSPPGVAVFLDGEKVGASQSEITLHVAAGNHPMRLEAPGYDSFQMLLVIGPGDTVVKDLISLTPSKRPDAPPVPPATPPAQVYNPPPVYVPPPPAGLSTEAVRGVIRSYLNAAGSGDIDGIAACFASGADFFGEGSLSTAEIRNSRISFRRQWPQYTVTALSDINIADTGDPSVKIARYEYRFIARSGQKYSAGTAHDTVTVKLLGGRALITRASETFTDRDKNYK